MAKILAQGRQLRFSAPALHLRNEAMPWSEHRSGTAFSAAALYLRRSKGYAYAFRAHSEHKRTLAFFILPKHLRNTAEQMTRCCALGLGNLVAVLLGNIASTNSAGNLFGGFLHVHKRGVDQHR